MAHFAITQTGLVVTGACFVVTQSLSYLFSEPMYVQRASRVTAIFDQLRMTLSEYKHQLRVSLGEGWWRFFSVVTENLWISIFVASIIFSGSHFINASAGVIAFNYTMSAVLIFGITYMIWSGRKVCAVLIPPVVRLISDIVSPQQINSI